MADTSFRLHWVDRGPFLVVPETWAPHWEGSDPPSKGRVVQATFRWNSEGPATDYDRAFDVPADGLAVLPRGPGQGLVLSTDAATAYYQDNRGQHLLLGWQYAPSEPALLDCVHDRTSELALSEEVEFHHPGGKLLLICAADSPGSWVFDRDEFELPAGGYCVSLCEKRGHEVAVLVCRLLRIRD